MTLRIFMFACGCFFLTAPTAWAIHRYLIDGNGLWFMTIVGAPIMSLAFFALSRLRP